MVRGDRVIYTSDKYGDGACNPRWGGRHGFVVGRVTEINNNKVRVTWGNGQHNNYNIGDLIKFHEYHQNVDKINPNISFKQRRNKNA